MDLSLPFGGWKQSGVGREGGAEGRHSFLEEKPVYLPNVPAGLLDLASQHGGFRAVQTRMKGQAGWSNCHWVE